MIAYLVDEVSCSRAGGSWIAGCGGKWPQQASWTVRFEDWQREPPWEPSLFTNQKPLRLQNTLERT